MARATRISGRQLAREAGEDLRFQVLSWRAHRIAWGVGLLLLAATLLGAFGHGPASEATATSADGRLSVSYERFARHRDPLTLEVHAAELPAGAATVVVWLDRGYLDSLDIRSIVPEPSRVLQADGRTGFEFELAEGSREFDARFEVEFQLVFLRNATIAIDGGREVAFSQFVYP